MQTAKVFHLNPMKMPDYIISGFAHTRIRELFAAGEYSPVAEVQIDDEKKNDDALEDAYIRTNHGENSWNDDTGIQLLSTDAVRSTSQGDIIQMDNVYYVVEMAGFKQIDLSNGN